MLCEWCGEVVVSVHGIFIHYTIPIEQRNREGERNGDGKDQREKIGN